MLMLKSHPCLVLSPLISVLNAFYFRFNQFPKFYHQTVNLTLSLRPHPETELPKERACKHLVG